MRGFLPRRRSTRPVLTRSSLCTRRRSQGTIGTKAVLVGAVSLEADFHEAADVGVEAVRLQPGVLTEVSDVGGGETLVPGESAAAAAPPKAMAKQR